MDGREGSVPFDPGGESAETWYRLTGGLSPDGPAEVVEAFAWID